MNDKDTVAESTSFKILDNSVPKSGEIAFLNDLIQNEEVKARLQEIERAINESLGEDGEPKILYDTAKHLLMAGGKRIRSLLVILCCEAVGEDAEKALPFAVATELAQTASLIHDDIIDEDVMRRGVESTHEKFGYKMAILAGDLLISKAVLTIGNLATCDLLMKIAENGIRMCEGEATDMLLQGGNSELMTKRNYLEMIEKKTVLFFRSASSTGVSIGGCTEEQYIAMENYGENLGYAFQIRDDVLNIISSTETIGKSVHSDLFSKRCTYPLVHALESSSKDKYEECLSSLSNGDISIALELIRKTNAIPESIKVTESYVERAKQALEGHGFQKVELLKQIADFILHRLH